MTITDDDGPPFDEPSILGDGLEEDGTGNFEDVARADRLAYSSSEGESESEAEYEKEDLDGIEINSDSDDEDESVANEHHQASALSPILRVLLIFLLIWQYTFTISESGITVLILFLYQFLKLVSSVTQSTAGSLGVEHMPLSLRSIYKTLQLQSSNFKQYVICPKCNSVYDMECCYQRKANGELESNVCEYVQFPNHPQRRQRQKCGEILMKRVRLRGGKVKLKPRKVYCYSSLIDTLSKFVNRPGFLKKITEWRNRKMQDGVMGDIYDGKLWKSMQILEGKPFLSDPYTLACSLNVDWFQPFTRSQYSVGVLYLVIHNLPRQERYKRENVILSGIIPGPNEPKGDINSYLSPLVQDLLDFYCGVKLKVVNGMLCPLSITFRVALISVIADIPAARKVAGIVGHSVKLGCSRCLKEFTCAGFGEKLDYSGFNRDEWESRTNESHRINAEKHKYAKTKAAKHDIESSSGTKYSTLLKLPYFDAIKFIVIDPMHNLLLGTTKHCFKTWKEVGILSSEQINKIEARIDLLTIPYDIGRVPSKFDNGGMGHFTADQCRNWTIVYSLICLKGILPEPDLACWRMFVQACNLFCRPVVTTRDIDLADQLLVLFCQKFEELYGPMQCTPNMHLHLHLKDCLLDYGPVYSFWCFAFERFNGILGSYPTNNKNIEAQIFKKFQLHQQLSTMPLPSAFPELSEVLQNCMTDYAAGSLHYYTIPVSLYKKLQDMRNPHFQPKFLELQSQDWIKCLPPRYEKVLDSVNTTGLMTVYKFLYPDAELKVCPQFYDQFSRIEITGDILGSIRSRTERSSVVLANWYCRHHKPCVGTSANCDLLRAGQILYYARHQARFSYEGKDIDATHIFAYVRWYKCHPNTNWFGHPVSVWTPLYEDYSADSFIPIQRIQHRCAFSKMSVDFGVLNESVIITVPVTWHFSL